jgi:hypothetical protein
VIERFDVFHGPLRGGRDVGSWHVSTVFECPSFGRCWGEPNIATEPKWSE